MNKILLSMLLSTTVFVFSAAHAVTVTSTTYTVDSNPNVAGGGTLEKAVDFFIDTSFPSIVTGQADGGPGGLYMYTSPSKNLSGPWQRTTITGSGNFYERAVPFTYPGDTYPGVIASVSDQVLWFDNPKNWGGDPTQPWGNIVINPNAGCHKLFLADIDGDGKQDVVCSGTSLDSPATGPYIIYQNNYNNWTPVPMYGPNGPAAGDSIGLISINGGPRNNIVGCSGTSLYWYANPANSGGNPRTSNWTANYIGSCNQGVELSVGSFNGHDGVIVVANEGNSGGEWAPGLVWYDPQPNGTWAMNQIDSSYVAAHQITTGILNGVSYFTVGEQEQACIVNDGAPPEHTNSSLGCRVAVFTYNGGSSGSSFTPTILSTTGTQNQATIPWNGGFLMVGANHGLYGGYPAIQAWQVSFGSSTTNPGPLAAGNYTITDNASWALDGGFYYWSNHSDTTMAEYNYATSNGVSSNNMQQWNFVPSGSNYTIYSVGNGNSVALSDGSGTLQIGTGVDTWTVTASGSGYTVRNTRTGNYIAPDPQAQSATIHTSSTPVAWLIKQVGSSTSTGGLQAGTYAISDSANYAVDGGFYYWSNGSDKTMAEYSQASGNTYQQWNFVANGTNFNIYNVGDGNSVALSDGSGTLQIGAGVDAWTVAAASGGYTIKNARTGNYIGPDPVAQEGILHTSSTPTVWSIHAPQ